MQLDDASTLWLDALQLEQGFEPTKYPRTAISRSIRGRAISSGGPFVSGIDGIAGRGHTARRSPRAEASMDNREFLKGIQ